MNFKKWLEFADQGGIVNYFHMNNTVAGDGFEKIRSKWMAGHKPEKPYNLTKIFGKKNRKNNK